MRNLNYTRILFMLAFFALACFSCYWTAESLFIWQPTLTRVGTWLIAIVFYVLASICFAMVIKAFDKNATYESGLFSSRGGQLFFGVIGLLLFWIIASLPTNTHTLFYRTSIKGVISSDIDKTRFYLSEAKDNNVEIRKINNQFDSVKVKTDDIIERLRRETQNPGAPGIDYRFEQVLLDLNALFSSALNTSIKLQPAAKNGRNPSEWNKTVNHYQGQAYDKLKLYRDDCDKKIKDIEQLMGGDSLLVRLINNCNNASSNIDKMKGVDNDVIKEIVDKVLTKGYNYIGSHAKYIEFNDNNDKERFTRPMAIPESKEMLSVYDIWKDYLTTDKYNGHGFIWWVLIAFLVDLAAFIFAYKAFNNINN